MPTNTKPASTLPNADIEMIKEQLQQLLALEFVDQIYFVDERIGGYDVGIIVGLVINALQTGKETQVRGIVNGGFSLDKDISILPDYLTREWDSLLPEQQKDVFIQVARISDATWISDLQKVEQISTYFDNLQPLTPDAWDNQKNNIIEHVLPDRKIIVLFDEEFGDTNPRKGHNLIEEIKENNWLKSVIPIIFSNKISTYAAELEWRNSLAASDESTLEKKDFFALSKSRSTELEAFADGIKKALLNNYIESIKTASLEIFDNALAETRKSIENLDPYNFDDVVLRTSSKEGIWEPFTLQRIIRIFQEDFIHQNMISTGYVKQMNQSIESAKSISLINIPNPAVEPYLEKLKLRHKEIFLSDKIINGLNYPLENGDIFEIQHLNGIKEDYVLVAQECDLMVRSDGIRTTNIGLLLPIENIDLSGLTKTAKENKLKEVEKMTATTFKIKYYIEGLHSIGKVSFKNPLYVDIDFLDLTVFDADGIAKISFDAILPNENEFGASWEKRYRIIFNKFKHLMQRTTKYQELAQKADGRVVGRWIRRQVVSKDFAQKLQMYLLPTFSFPQKLEIPIRLGNQSIEIGIRRIKRLRYPDSKHLLDKFTRYQARNADLHDFAE